MLWDLLLGYSQGNVEYKPLDMKRKACIWTLEACISQNIWVLWRNRTVATYYRGRKESWYTSALFLIYRITKMLLEEKILLLHDKNVVLHHSLASHGVFRWQSPLPINQELDLIPSRGTQWVYLREETNCSSWKKKTDKTNLPGLSFRVAENLP